ncbi:zinc finger, RING/FYVE/PHD-type [Artemisia annua]|uniref:Zinc finger, RING/FYVE/PHD-type n=1 Tax=Artemisia annua TaxID=35608 RepID=A0A2U1N910_ARTAN|nr:zinc finger, RING/FYVE/PHD-type [Artemisia annua]
MINKLVLICITTFVENAIFVQVGESLPVSDGSMDAVVGTLVLCSVEDVNKTLQEIKRVLKPGGLYIFVEHVAAKDGTFLKVIQRVLDPLQQTVADGCHLTRETGDSISAAGFSSVDIKTTFLSSASLINPHAYGIALKPHGSNAVSQDWSMGPHDPYWRTNTSFSPPPPRWDFRFQNEGQSFGSQEGSRLYGSSTSSNSRESRSWLRGNYVPNHRHSVSVSDGYGAFFSSPYDLSPAQQWSAPIIQEISFDEYNANSSKRVLGPLPFSPNSEGLSAPHDGRASISSNSDSSDYDPISKSLSSHHNFTARGCFMSKAVHPLALPVPTNTPKFHDLDDFEFSDVSEPMERGSFNRSNGHKCSLCERFLSQRSPWSSRNGDMPVTGVLSCRHVFHADCLDQTTPKTQKGDPPCPICCAKSEPKSSPDQRVSSKVKNGIPRVRAVREDGPSSRPWGCVQAGNCVEGALSAPPRNAMLLLNRNRIKKNLSLKKSGSCSSQSGGSDGVGCSKSASSSRKKS